MSSERSERMNYRLSEMSGGTDQLYTSCSTPRPSQLSEHISLKPFPVNGVVFIHNFYSHIVNKCFFVLCISYQ